LHEVGIINDILDIATDAARESGASHITAVRVKVGELSGVVPDALSFAFEVVAESTIAAGASLIIEPIPAACSCTLCGMERMQTNISDCPECGGKSVMSHGYELLVSSIEVD
jgi:hydrogenase nickel incorporation protein HypA/HybF